MSPLAIAFIVFCCTFAAAMIGMTVHSRLPDDHLDNDSKDVVKLVMGLIGTLAALVLGLLIASANSSYQSQSTALQATSADVVALDRTLAHFGPEATVARDLLRRAVTIAHDRIWSSGGVRPEGLDPAKVRTQVDQFYDAVLNLSPKTDDQRFDRTSALQLVASLARTRTLMFEQSGASISSPFLLVLVFWIVVLFLGFGLFARYNATVTVALVVGALSVSGSIFLLLELSEPYRGLIKISDAPFRYALGQITTSPR